MKSVWIEGRLGYSVSCCLKSLFRDIYVTLQDLEFHTNNFNVSPVLPVMTSDLFQSWSLSPDRSTILFHDQVGVWGRLSATFCADYFFLCMVFPWTPLVHQPGPDPASSQSYKSMRTLRDRWRCACKCWLHPWIKLCPRGDGGTSAWVTRGGCHGSNYSNTDATLALFS